MYSQIIFGIMLPFVGTVVGAGCVFLTRRRDGNRGRRLIEGFSAGVMVAASIWSLLIPSMELAEGRGIPPAVPAAAGFLLGIVFFLACDRLLLRRPNIGTGETADLLGDGGLSALAVAIHNLPEGMAVGAIYAELLCGADPTAASAALALSIGITVQNLPEGAIISLPLYASGKGKLRSFVLGGLSGAVEPLGAILTILAAGIAVPLLPYLLGFAAGAMMYAVLEEFTGKGDSDRTPFWILSFSAGFLLMMSLDVLLS